MSNTNNYNEFKTILLNSRFITGVKFKNKINRELPYKILENDDTIQIHFGNNNYLCGMIQIEKELKEVEILSFGYHPRCTAPEIPKHVGTHILLQEMLNILMNIIKNYKIQIDSILFSDNSSINVYSSNGEEYVSWLADSYRLIRGKTWYQSVMKDFIVQLKDKQIRLIADDDIKRYFTLFTKQFNYLDLFSIYYIVELSNKQIKLLENVWNKTQDNKLWETMNIILKEDDELFTKIYKPMMKNLNLTFITGNVFEIIPISQK